MRYPIAVAGLAKLLVTSPEAEISQETIRPKSRCVSPVRSEISRGFTLGRTVGPLYIAKSLVMALARPGHIECLAKAGYSNHFDAGVGAGC